MPSDREMRSAHQDGFLFAWACLQQALDLAEQIPEGQFMRPGVQYASNMFYMVYKHMNPDADPHEALNQYIEMMKNETLEVVHYDDGGEAADSGDNAGARDAASLLGHPPVGPHHAVPHRHGHHGSHGHLPGQT